MCEQTCSGARDDDGKLSLLHCSYVLEPCAATIPGLHELLGFTGLESRCSVVLIW